MTGKRVPVLVGVAAAGTTLLTATALGAVTGGFSQSGRAEMAAGLTSSVVQNGIEVRAAAGAARVAAGAAVPVMVTVRSQTSKAALIDLEAYGPTGHRVYQRVWQSQQLEAGRTATWSASWTPPATAGRYRIAVGVFSDGWGPLLAWNKEAAFVVVGGAGALSGPVSWSTPSAGTRQGAGSAGGPVTGALGPAPARPDAVPTTATQPRAAHGAAPSGPSGPEVPDAPAPPAGGPARRFVTLPVSAALPSGADCAARVGALRAPAEVKGVNATANATPGEPLAGATGLLTRVDGAFTGTTEQVLRWAACKWGIDEDVVKAQAAVESWWRMDTKGDWGTDATRCAPGHGLGADGTAGSCPESFGLMQVRYPYHQIAFPFAATSSALNVDYALAQWRDCYVGDQSWLNTVEHGSTYAPGDVWGCLGVWFSGRWHTAPADDYIGRVKDYLSRRIWTTPDFAQP